MYPDILLKYPNPAAKAPAIITPIIVPRVALTDFTVNPSIRYIVTIVVKITTTTADQNGEYPL